MQRRIVQLTVQWCPQAARWAPCWAPSLYSPQCHQHSGRDEDMRVLPHIPLWAFLLGLKSGDKEGVSQLFQFTKRKILQLVNLTSHGQTVPTHKRLKAVEDRFKLQMQTHTSSHCKTASSFFLPKFQIIYTSITFEQLNMKSYEDLGIS